jgi:hypothetical protein
MVRELTLGALALAAGVFVSGAQAAVITYDASIEFSGATPPAGAGPWLRTTISDAGADTVTIEFNNIGLVGTEFVANWFLNLNPALNPVSLNFQSPVQVGSFALPTINRGVNAFQADGDGLFDVRLDFSNAGPQRFGVGEKLTYTVTGISGLNATDFAFVSVNGPVGANGFPMAAHVLSIGPNGEGSGWVSVPEPAALSVLALATPALLRRRRGA